MIVVAFMAFRICRCFILSLTRACMTAIPTLLLESRKGSAGKGVWELFGFVIADSVYTTAQKYQLKYCLQQWLGCLG